MIAGPIFTREAVVAPRRLPLYLLRLVYGGALVLLIATAWMVIAGTQVVRNISDLARFGSILLQILAPLQLVLLLFVAATQSASRVAIEKDRQTLILLLMTRMTNVELVVGKMLASLISVATMLLTAAPIFMLVVLFGGTSFFQVAWIFAVTVASCLVAASLGTLIGYWREKTFQALALVLLAMVFWLGAGEAIRASTWNLGGFTAQQFGTAVSPLRALFAAASPDVQSRLAGEVVPFLAFSLTATALLAGIAVVMVRRWNPSRDVRPGQQEEPFVAGELPASSPDSHAPAPKRAGSVSDGPQSAAFSNDTCSSPLASDSAAPVGKEIPHRQVWDNPVLWREMCTWAYGRKILFIRFAWWLLVAGLGALLWWQVSSGLATRTTSSTAVTIPVVAQPLAPLLVVALVILNALAVSSVTQERDGKALDLLQMTDLSPREFLFGKLLGVLYVAADVIILPLLIFGWLWWNSVVTMENLVFLVLGLLILDLFVAVLGIHCGMVHGNSRTAIAVSLGTVFFLFLGILTAMLIMVSFTGNVEAQLTPFLAAIVGGAIGLYVALGWNSQSSALVVAAGLLPISMFYCITSLLLKNYGSVMVVLALAYGFAIVALTVPKLNEFHFASAGRSRAEADD